MTKPLKIIPHMIIYFLEFFIYSMSNIITCHRNNQWIQSILLRNSILWKVQPSISGIKKNPRKQLNGLILTVYFGIEKTQNMINITSKLSLLKDIVWKCYKIYYVKFTVVLSGKLWEIIIRESKDILTYSDTNMTVFFQIINMLILHLKISFLT